MLRFLYCLRRIKVVVEAKHLSSRVHTEVLKWSDLRGCPAFLFIPVNGQHVIRENLPEGQLVNGRLRLQLVQTGLANL